MLVLSRKLQQSIRIGDSVTITILQVKGKSVRIGIEAPESIKIVRGELPDYTARQVEIADIAVAAVAEESPARQTDRDPGYMPLPTEAADEPPLGFTDYPTIGWESMGWDSGNASVSRPR
ncbi:MAG: carbon storage regulator [Pirellulales bacterium]